MMFVKTEWWENDIRKSIWNFHLGRKDQTSTENWKVFFGYNPEMNSWGANISWGVTKFNGPNTLPGGQFRWNNCINFGLYVGSRKKLFYRTRFE